MDSADNDFGVTSEPSMASEKENSARNSSSILSTSAITSWAKSLKLPQMTPDSQTVNAGKLTFSRLTSGLGLQMPSKPSSSNETENSNYFILLRGISIITHIVYFLLSWLNTTMMENRVILDGSDLDGFDKRKLPSPGFQVEIVMIDYDGAVPSKVKTDLDTNSANATFRDAPSSSEHKANPDQSNASRKQKEEDDVFSDSDTEEPANSRSKIGPGTASHPKSGTSPSEQISSISHQTEQLSLGRNSPSSHFDTSHETKLEGIQRASSNPNMESTDLKAIAADASVFSFGDDEDDESD